MQDTQDSQDRPVRVGESTGQLGQDRKGGASRQDSWDWADRTGRAEHGSKDRIAGDRRAGNISAGTCQRGEDYWDRTAEVGLSGQDRGDRIAGEGGRDSTTRTGK